MPKILEISKLLDNDIVNFLSYAVFFDNGTFCNLDSNMPWCKHYYDHFLAKENKNIFFRLKTGINYWRRNKNSLSELDEDARNNFDIDARIDCIYRDELNKCFYQYSFCSNYKNADRAYTFYGNHMSRLLRFIPIFNKEARYLITEANKPENRLMIENYTPISLKEATCPRNYADELRLENASFEPTSREFEVMLLYAHGLPKSKIAKMLCKEVSTIETHIDNIRNKSSLTDRFSMLMYLKDRGEDIAINFFFPYTQGSH